MMLVSVALIADGVLGNMQEKAMNVHKVACNELARLSLFQKKLKIIYIRSSIHISLAV